MLPNQLGPAVALVLAIAVVQASCHDSSVADMHAASPGGKAIGQQTQLAMPTSAKPRAGRYGAEATKQW